MAILKFPVSDSILGLGTVVLCVLQGLFHNI